MARTKEGAVLTERHRLAQDRLANGSLRDFMRLWPLWEGDPESFRRLIAASLPLIRQYHSTSSSVAASYYEAFRDAEDPGGAATPLLAAFDPDRVAADLYVTGQRMTGDALAAGVAPRKAMENALTSVSGAVILDVLKGGRDTITLSTAADKKSGGWARVTSPSCCAFCAMLAGRGPVYSEDTSDFEAHRACKCSNEPVYSGSAWPGRADEFRTMYNRAVDQAGKAGELRRGTSNDLLNAFRRVYDAEKTAVPGGQP